MRTKYVMMITGLLLVTGAVTSATKQHHPFSQLFPPDQDLNLGGKDLENVSELEVDTIRPNNTRIRFTDDGNVDILVWDDANSEWDVKNSDLNLNSNELKNFFASACGKNEAIKQIYANGSYNCGQAGGGLPTVLSINNSAANYSINLNGQNITSDTGNASIGDSLMVYGNIWLMGGASASADDSLKANLSATLNAGSSAGEHDIDLNGNMLENVSDINPKGANVTFGGTINVSGNRIKGVPAPVSGGDAVNKTYVDTSDDTVADDQTLSDVLGRGNSTGSYDINLNGNRLLTGGAMINITSTSTGENIARFEEDGDINLSEADVSIDDATGRVKVNHGDLLLNGVKMRLGEAAFDSNVIGDGEAFLARSDGTNNGNGDILVGSDEGGTERQSRLYDYSTGEISAGRANADFEVPNGNLNVTSNNITASGDEICMGKYCN